MQRPLISTYPVPRRRLLGRTLLVLVSTDACGVAAVFVVAALTAAGRHHRDATGLLLVALVGLAGVLLALIAIPAAVRTFDDARRALRATRRSAVLISVGLVINTVGSMAIILIGGSRGPVDLVAVLLLVAGDVLSVLYLLGLHLAHQGARAAN